MSEAFDLTASTGTGPGARRTVERAPGRTPLIGNYEERCKTFTWDEARRWVDGLPGGCLNIAHEAVDRQAAGGLVRSSRKQGRAEIEAAVTAAEEADVEPVANLTRYVTSPAATNPADGSAGPT